MNDLALQAGNQEKAFKKCCIYDFALFIVQEFGNIIISKIKIIFTNINLQLLNSRNTTSCCSFKEESMIESQIVIH